MSGPSNKWSWHSPPPVAKAAEFVRYVGPGWDAAQGKREAIESHTHMPLPVGIPIARDANEPPPPPLPQPTEAELRQRLAETVTLADEARAQADAAQAAHRRSKELIESRKVELASFDGLQDEITAATVAGLREGDGRYDLPDELKDRSTQRDHAKAALFAAESAEQVLQDDVAQARDRLRVREQARYVAASALLAITAESIAVEIVELEAKIIKLQGKLLGFDGLSAGAPSTMGAVTRDTLFELGRIATPEQRAPWVAAAEALYRDPQAPLVVDDPQPPLPPLNLVVVTPHVAQAQAARKAAEAQAAAQATDRPDETNELPEPGAA
jgi:hypothetical protein